MLIDGEYLKEVFLECYSNGQNAVTAFDVAMKMARRKSSFLGGVDGISPQCMEFSREGLREIHEKNALYAAQDIKDYCKSTVCEACVFWRKGSDAVFCELHDKFQPCGWEV